MGHDTKQEVVAEEIRTGQQYENGGEGHADDIDQQPPAVVTARANEYPPPDRGR